MLPFTLTAGWCKMNQARASVAAMSSCAAPVWWRCSLYQIRVAGWSRSGMKRGIMAGGGCCQKQRVREVSTGRSGGGGDVMALFDGAVFVQQQPFVGGRHDDSAVFQGDDFLYPGGACLQVAGRGGGFPLAAG